MGWERGELASEPPDEQPFPLLRSIVYAAHCTFSLIQIFKIVKINFVKYKNSQKLLRGRTDNGKRVRAHARFETSFEIRVLRCCVRARLCEGNSDSFGWPLDFFLLVLSYCGWDSPYG